MAILHDGEPIPAEHGGPARLIVPRLYAWKSAKWIAGVELIAQDRAGFWEANGYHMRGDPWPEERYRACEPLQPRARRAASLARARDVRRSRRGRLLGSLGVDLVEHAGDVQR